MFKNWYWVHVLYFHSTHWIIKLVEGTGNWIWDIVHYRLKSGGYYRINGKTLEGQSWWYFVKTYGNYD